MYLLEIYIYIQVPNCLVHLSAFFSSFLVRPILSWRFAVGGFPFSMLLIMSAIIFRKVMKDLGDKTKDAYGDAGSLAEQAISSSSLPCRWDSDIKEVQLWTWKEHGAWHKVGLHKSCGDLEHRVDICNLGISNLGRKCFDNGESGGHVFAAEICIIWGGLWLSIFMCFLSFL